MVLICMTSYKLISVHSLEKEGFTFFGILGATDKPCGKGVWMLTKKIVAKRYMIA